MGVTVEILAHPGQRGWRYWPAKGPRAPPSVADEVDYPLAHGVLGVTPPGESGGDDRSLRRVITAWFVRNGLFGVCFRCGTDLTRVHPRDLRVQGYSVLNTGRQLTTPPMRHMYRCPECEMVATVSYCSDCRRTRPNPGLTHLIYKYAPHLEQGTDADRAELSTSWTSRMEFMQPVQERERHYARHCARCGSDYIPTEGRSGAANAP